jgi:hypothetical protein
MSAEHPQNEPVRRWHHGHWPLKEGRFHLSVALFLVVLIIMFVSLPFLESFEGGKIMASILMTAVLLSAVLAIGGRSRSFVWGIILVTPAVVFQWLNHLWPDINRAYSVAPGIVFVSYIVVHLFGFIFRARKVNSEVICAGVANYLLMGLLWSFAYVLLADISPDAFAFTAGPDRTRVMQGFNCIYFSFVTLSTIGYGDIVPVSSAARMISITEATTGMFYVAILISRLVSLQTAAAARQDEE